MRVLLDTNVSLDVLQQRAPWAQEAIKIWQAVITGQMEACVSSSAVTDVFYISRRLVGATAARGIIRVVLDELTVLTVDEKLLETAYALPVADFEDALQVAVVQAHALDALVTRDSRGFVGSGITVWDPGQLAAQI